jgi:hypothetical protein
MTDRVVSHLRSGLAAEVSSAAVDGAATGLRATGTVRLTVSANDGSSALTTPREIELYGPGDVVGIDPSEIVGHYPQPGTPDAEPNYFCHVEFASGDLPWRYSPVGPDTQGRTPPWLGLVVVEEGEEAVIEERPQQLAVLHTSAAHLPPSTQLWAWAHAFGTGNDESRFRSRLLCPRRLRADTTWTACVVPAFAAGRSAGLGGGAGSDPGPAWATGDVSLPIYHSWQFTTGEGGDFRELARRLTPRELPGDVGARRLDIREPGIPLPHREDARAEFVGAMYSPQYQPRVTDPDIVDAFARAYRNELAAPPVVRNGAVPDYDARRDDPVVRLPRYGSPQRSGEPLPKDDSHWYAQVNTSPVHRSVAGLGAEVVRRDQEALMAAAWEHAAALPKINSHLQRSRLAAESATHRIRKVDSLGQQRLEVLGPALRSMAAAPVVAELRAARIPAAITTGAFRRTGRMNGPLSRRRTRVDAAGVVARRPSPATAVTAMAIEVGTTALLGYAEVGLPSGMDFGARLVIETGRSAELGPVLHSERDEIVFVRPRASVHDGTAVGAIRRIGSTNVSFTAGPPASLTSTPGAGVTLSLAGPPAAVARKSAAPPATATASATPTPIGEHGAAKKVVAKQSAAKKTAAKQSAAKKAVAKQAGATMSVTRQRSGSFAGLQVEMMPGGSAPPVFTQPAPASYSQLAATVLAARVATPPELVLTRPADTMIVELPSDPPPLAPSGALTALDGLVDPIGDIVRLVDQHVVIRRGGTPRSATAAATTAAKVPAKLGARPKFDTPMYERLRALSAEYVLPGVGLVPENSVGVLSVNNAFIESFLVGANHELSREFRWREYPTELHRTWFDQFWDAGPETPADIEPIASWGDNTLGGNAEGGNRLVLLVKGDLVQRYPNLSVYMVEASLDPKAGADHTRIATPGADVVDPDFIGELEPGIQFYGFKVPGPGRNQVDRAQHGGAKGQGWFFAFEEQLRSPRFGLDAGRPAQRGTMPDEWSQLAWGHLSAQADDEAERFVDATTSAHVSIAEGGFRWFADAATMARLTFRRPSRVLIHATAMLDGG